MTGYTVHTGATEKFVEGWDRVFGGRTARSGSQRKKAARGAKKKQSARSGKSPAAQKSGRKKKKK